MEKKYNWYYIDIVFVIDTTESMALKKEQVKKLVLSFDGVLKSEMQEHGMPMERLRTRVIEFGDYASSGLNTVRSTDFFVMNNDRQKFEDAVNGIKFNIPCGSASNALEALYTAMGSDWSAVENPNKGRHIIVLISDKYPLHLHERADCIGYPEDIFANLEEMENEWSVWKLDESKFKLSPHKKRLIMFVPDGQDTAKHTWENVMNWVHTVTWVLSPENGLPDTPTIDILNEIIREI